MKARALPVADGTWSHILGIEETLEANFTLLRRLARQNHIAQDVAAQLADVSGVRLRGDSHGGQLLLQLARF